MLTRNTVYLISESLQRCLLAPEQVARRLLMPTLLSVRAVSLVCVRGWGWISRLHSRCVSRGAASLAKHGLVRYVCGLGPCCSTSKHAGIYRLGRGKLAKVNGSTRSRFLVARRCSLALT